MEKIIAIMLLLAFTVSVLCAPVSAAGESTVASGPADTGDLFGIVIAMLLASAMGVAALVTHKTRFIQEDCKKAGGS